MGKENQKGGVPRGCGPCFYRGMLDDLFGSGGLGIWLGQRSIPMF